MPSSNTSSNTPSRAPTPNASHNARFTSQGATAEDLLKSHTVGLVHLTDFRKRRAEALEQKEREAHEGTLGRFTAASKSGTPLSSDGVITPTLPAKKKRKPAGKGKVSFGMDEEEGDDTNEDSSAATPRSATPDAVPSRIASPSIETTEKRRLGPNANVNFVPKAMTKSALLREAQTKEQLRKEFLAMQEAVKATEIVIPFVFYDGTNIPGGACKVKKGDYIWFFLDRSRKVGAELGVGGGEKNSSRREWARVGVDDLMLVRGEIIIPHHYDFYYFIVNKTLGHSSSPLFDYSSTMLLPISNMHSSSTSPSASPKPSTYDPLARPKNSPINGAAVPSETDLEGANDDPNFTKVVDRRWYERNKHIFPASVWEEFEPSRDYSKGMRRDAEGNAFFFS
ncbi:MAG: hypothetical protein LQ343_006943 [Gyalolechia ehrenbergii]|nr:MAG: hypothetical protein LQ343_006943 [Gyalolechia ehrenbergii]